MWLFDGQLHSDKEGDGAGDVLLVAISKELEGGAAEEAAETLMQDKNTVRFPVIGLFQMINTYPMDEHDDISL